MNIYIKRNKEIYGTKIEFPTLLLKELISTYLRSTARYDPHSFNFVYRGHYECIPLKKQKSFNFPADNTPQDLIGKTNSELNSEAKLPHLGYIRDYGYLNSYCERILLKAVDRSKLDWNIIRAACESIEYKPSKFNEKVLQHLFMIAVHANFLSASKNQYINCVHSYYENVLRKNKSFKKQQLNISTTPHQYLYHLPEIFHSQYSEFRNSLDEVIQVASSSDKIWLKITVTAPGEWHPNSSTWSGCSPADTKQYFQKKWRKIQNSLNKAGIRISGFWTFEFHADGCPHLNFLIATDLHNEAIVLKLFEKHFKHSGKSIHVKRKPAQGDWHLSRNIIYITKNLFPKVRSQNKHRRLFDRSIASIFKIRMYGFFGL